MIEYGPHDQGGLKTLSRLIQTRPAGFLLPVGPQVNINVLCVSGLGILRAVNACVGENNLSRGQVINRAPFFQNFKNFPRVNVSQGFVDNTE